MSRALARTKGAALSSNTSALRSPVKGNRFKVGEFSWIWIGTALLFAVSAVVAPGTVRPSALVAMLPFAAMLAIIAVGQTIVIQQRGLDMSSAGMMSFAGVFIAVAGFATGSVLLGALATVAACMVLGCVNGFLISNLNITPIIATLASNALLIGAVLKLSGGSPMAVPAQLGWFSHESVLGVPFTLVLALLFIAAVNVVTKRTLFGRRFIAVGASPRAAAAAGIQVLRYQIGTYAAAAVCFGVAGILYAGFIGSASHTAGDDYLLPGIAAVVVGGTPFTGGRGSVIASGVAALFMAQLSQMVLALGAGSATQLFVQAAAIVIATTIRHMPEAICALRPDGPDDITGDDGTPGARLDERLDPPQSSSRCTETAMTKRRALRSRQHSRLS